MLWRFIFVVGREHGGVHSLIPWYAVAWEIAASSAPWRSNSFWMSRYKLSGVGLFTASVVRWSAFSLPTLPACPLVYWKDMGAMHCLR